MTDTTTTFVFPTHCPHCGAFARYEASKEMVDGVHTYGLSTWECGWTFQRYLEEISQGNVEIAGKCRRVP